MHKTFAQFILHTFWCILMHIDTFWALRTNVENYYFLSKMTYFFLSAQNASICIRMQQNVFRMNFLYTKLSKKLFLLHLKRLKCINMHQSVSKCIKLYAELIILIFCAWNFDLKDFIFLGRKVNFFLSAQNASICIGMHQNVCRMNYSNVLCMKF